jgi:8-oxo-(d)GTP phosphatase
VSAVRPVQRARSTVPGSPDRPLTAAGAVLWRRRRRKIEVALIHRPRYDDWSWPKGKLDRGEGAAVAAVREVAEETGHTARLGIPLPRSLYALPRGELKEVRYWAATITGGDGVLQHEVDEVAWLTPGAARRRLTHPRDALQLQAVLDADGQGTLDTRPLLIVRHAASVARAGWELDDWLRPLNPDGLDRAAALIPLLAAYEIDEVVSSPSTRCLETVEPYVRARQARVVAKKGLSEERYAEQPEKVAKHTARALESGVPTALCTHRPLLPDLLGYLAGRATPLAAKALKDARRDELGKGEVVICQVAGTGESARIVSVERNRA